MSEQASVVTYAKENLALTASASLVLISVLRVYYFVAFRPDVALSVLSVANRTQVLVSTLLSILVLLAPLALFTKPLREWVLAGHATGAPFKVQLRTGLIWVPLTPLVLSTMSVLFIAGWGLGLAIIWGIERRMRRKAAANPGSEVMGSKWRGMHQWVVATAAGLALMGTLNAPWQPMEKISFQGDKKPVAGYVIGEQAGKTLIVDKARQARWTKNDDIASRELCDRGMSWWTASPVGIAAATAGQPQADCTFT